VPLSRTRAERFDDLVLDVVEELEERWGPELAAIDFAVVDAPGLEDEDAGDVEALPDEEAVPLGRALPASGGRRAQVIVYRRPVEARSPDPLALADLVHDVVVEQVARLLGMDPDSLDPPITG
jgi:predicted Zn-dependent protease with MMP-like domain